MLMLSHNLSIVVLVLFIVPPASWQHLWLVPVGFCLLLGNLLWIVLLLGLLSTRFRDIPQLVSNIVQVAFFVSPILWKADMLGAKARLAADLNPLYHFMEIVRAPLLGESIRGDSWIVAAGLLIVGWTLTFFAFVRLRSRVAYWL